MTSERLENHWSFEASEKREKELAELALAAYSADMAEEMEGSSGWAAVLGGAYFPAANFFPFGLEESA